MMLEDNSSFPEVELLICFVVREAQMEKARFIFSSALVVIKIFFGL